jgi:four helix bundle protein
MSRTVSESLHRPPTSVTDCGRGQPSRPPDADRGSGRDVHAVALEAAGAAIRLIMRVPTPLQPIADQLIRSASSVPANLAEGHGRSGRDRAHLWRIASASAREVDSHLRLLIAAGAIDRARADDALECFDRVRAMLWRLLDPAT